MAVVCDKIMSATGKELQNKLKESGEAYVKKLKSQASAWAEAR